MPITWGISVATRCSQRHIPIAKSLEEGSCQPIGLRIQLRAATQVKSQPSLTFAATRMKRCPVLLHLALITVALFADDVKFVTQLPAATDSPAVVAIQADSSSPRSAIRLMDAEGSLAEVARSGRSNRDSAAKLFPGTQTPLNAVCSGKAPSLKTPPPSTSSLLSQHTRLQI